jgi:hypothetical protein
MKTDVNVPSKSNKQKFFEKNLVFVGILKATDDKCRIRISTVSLWYGSADPDPYQNVKDPRH